MTNKPTKIFPCECMSEGVTVVIEEDEDLSDCQGAPFVGMAFWNFGPRYGPGDQLNWRERIGYAWHILRGRSPWTQMICMRAKVAQNLANHILYLISKARKRQDESKMLVKPGGSEVRDEQREYEEYKKAEAEDFGQVIKE